MRFLLGGGGNSLVDSMDPFSNPRQLMMRHSFFRNNRSPVAVRGEVDGFRGEGMGIFRDVSRRFLWGFT